MKKSVKFVKAVLSTAAAVAVVGSGVFAQSALPVFAEETEVSEYARELKYRRMPTATSDLFEAGVAPILESWGYTLTPVEITDSIQREIALSEDEIDFHIDAHTAYINSFNENQGTELATVLAIPTVPTGLYPGSKDSLDDLEEGDSVAFPSDASNEARALLLLSQNGLLELDESVDPTQYTLADITENPYNLELFEMDGPTIAAVRTDFDYIILRGSDAYNSGTELSTALAAESQDAILDNNRMQVVVNGPHKDEGWVQDIIKAYQSEEFKEFMETQSEFWILPDYLQ